MLKQTQSLPICKEQIISIKMTSAISGSENCQNPTKGNNKCCTSATTLQKEKGKGQVLNIARNKWKKKKKGNIGSIALY